MLQIRISAADCHIYGHDTQTSAHSNKSITLGADFAVSVCVLRQTLYRAEVSSAAIKVDIFQTKRLINTIKAPTLQKEHHIRDKLMVPA